MHKLTKLLLSAMLITSAFSLQPSAFAQGNCAAGTSMYSGVDGVPEAFGGQGLTNCVSTGPMATSNVVWFIAPVSYKAAPRLLDLSFTGDLVGKDMTIYTSTNAIGITNGGGISGTNQLWVQNGSSVIASNDIIVIQYTDAGLYQRCMVTNATTSQISIFPSAAVTNGPNDRIWKMTQIAVLPTPGVGRTNYNRGAGGFFIGKKGSPLLCEMLYSNAATIHSITGDYYNGNGGKN